ncbi:uncharacterized protein UMAG_12179 [Mycosarcoma maydis]|uniref:Uncharacterized protein n=1 Tax=Mycosarcoma maydis TaxID=5270 RepID=A0A0D1E0X5_MYCMD|nr:uncharacterized protein UMAG_12179 [Ustilago maydis 521]KIS69511.1 hypothetical protein UMAG_12179 [Ustilago maydis 521]|eukprot:XP_011388909.1 hypothetical protein UMAG_12179 [Ustilago maydis 521]
MADVTPERRNEEIHRQLHTLQVLEAELRSLKPGAKVYNAISTPLDKARVIPHAHNQMALFPNLDSKTALKDVERQKKVLLANLAQLEP